MISQIFKTFIDKQILFEFLDMVSSYRDDMKYKFDISSYKRAIHLDVLNNFIETVKPYYHLSKRVYVDKKQSYKMITTVIRQICRLNGIFYKQEIKYAKSSYEIVYHIYCPDKIHSQVY
jgi:hypothetical protein